jgi:meiotically up-regulated gene 157 (Mug157) protein
MSQLPDDAALVQRMQTMSDTIRSGIQSIGIMKHNTFRNIYAYETDGFGSYNIMGDANIPSLLSAPLIGYTDLNDEVYRNTRAMLLSPGNPYFMRGRVINAVGGPHEGPGYAWPMASIVRVMTSEDDKEIMSVLKELVSSTDGLGLTHESIWASNASDYSRSW